MGWLAAQGAIMAIGLFIGLVCSVIGLFFGHIILFDSIALGIAAGVCCNQFTAIHPALCLVIGIATFLLLLWLQKYQHRLLARGRAAHADLCGGVRTAGLLHFGA